ncbi:MAG TPA: lipid-A-disaccharide synthase [Nevskiaceae bacterium]|nr:lipid-A-disaccharide synthase [Nevskiaceae bacterium]
MTTFALIAGELSGDLLGAALIRALRTHFPEATFRGVAGPRMVEAGCEAVESIESLSLFGLLEVLPAIPRLLKLRAALVDRFASERPDAVIGIDAPDFNLGLERRLRERGLPTVHVVSPTVWAWREGRVKGIARAVDLILCLFPFEPKFYQGHGVRAAYIGHPLADELDDRVTPAAARRALGLGEDGPVVAVLPGSRSSELQYLGEPFARAARLLHDRVPGVRFVTPIAKPKLRAGMEAAIAAHAPGCDWTVVDGRSREAMQAADAVLLASGTATLECLLLGRPMVVAYRGAWLTAFLMLRAGLLKTKHVSLPNLLADEPTVVELLQDQATPERLAEECAVLLAPASARRLAQLRAFDAVRARLRCDAASVAAREISALVGERGLGGRPSGAS